MATSLIGMNIRQPVIIKDELTIRLQKLEITSRLQALEHILKHGQFTMQDRNAYGNFVKLIVNMADDIDEGRIPGNKSFLQTARKALSLFRDKFGLPSKAFEGCSCFYVTAKTALSLPKRVEWLFMSKLALPKILLREQSKYFGSDAIAVMGKNSDRPLRHEALTPKALYVFQEFVYSGTLKEGIDPSTLIHLHLFADYIQHDQLRRSTFRLLKEQTKISEELTTYEESLLGGSLDESQKELLKLSTKIIFEQLGQKRTESIDFTLLKKFLAFATAKEDETLMQLGFGLIADQLFAPHYQDSIKEEEIEFLENNQVLNYFIYCYLVWNGIKHEFAPSGFFIAPSALQALSKNTPLARAVSDKIFGILLDSDEEARELISKTPTHEIMGIKVNKLIKTPLIRKIFDLYPTCIFLDIGVHLPLWQKIPRDEIVCLAIGALSNVELAEELFKEALKIHPMNFRPYALLGVIYLGQEKWEKAEEHFLKALLLSPKNSTLINSLHSFYHVYNKKNQAYPGTAIKYDQAIEKGLTQFDILSMLGDVYRRQREYKKAVGRLELAHNYNPTDVFTLSRLGAVYSNLELLDKAQETLELAIQLDENYFFSLVQLGAVYREQGKLDQAAKTLEKVIKLKPDIIDALDVLGATYLEQGNPSLAKPFFLRSFELNPKNVFAVSKLGEVYRLLGNLTEAEKQLLSALEVKPEELFILKK